MSLAERHIDYCLFSNSILLWLEKQGKQDGNHQGIASKYQPAARPVTHQVTICIKLAIVIDDLTSQQGTDRCAQAIGHQHEQALSRSPDLGITLLVNKQASRNIEEIECHAIYDARKYKQDDTREGWITQANMAIIITILIP